MLKNVRFSELFAFQNLGQKSVYLYMQTLIFQTIKLKTLKGQALPLEELLHKPVARVQKNALVLHVSIAICTSDERCPPPPPELLTEIFLYVLGFVEIHP